MAGNFPASHRRKPGRRERAAQSQLLLDPEDAAGNSPPVWDLDDLDLDSTPDSIDSVELKEPKYEGHDEEDLMRVAPAEPADHYPDAIEVDEEESEGWPTIQEADEDSVGFQPDHFATTHVPPPIRQAAAPAVEAFNSSPVMVNGQLVDPEAIEDAYRAAREFLGEDDSLDVDDSPEEPGIFRSSSDSHSLSLSLDPRSIRRRTVSLESDWSDLDEGEEESYNEDAINTSMPRLPRDT